MKIKKILSIDYGIKRCGLSITNNSNDLAIGLSCVKTNEIFNYLDLIIKKENVHIIVLGYPKKLNNKNQYITNMVLKFKKLIIKLYPNLIIDLIDERYTSKIAKLYLNSISMSKKYLKEKINILSSTLILQSYLKINKKKI
ncbi:MAG: Holliday junction resolvase RuvX [Candidatus Shikimatogenerans sp. JK-2022]|nr:Holliday junction resolvase RuvX [Candidatus Shikimatogenerans bostrichidophilus]